MKDANLILDTNEYELPIVVGSEGEVGLDVRSLRNQSGAITYDPGYGNTGSCESAITFIDGEKGILRYRGYPIEQIAAASRFSEVCYLLVYGRLPDQREYDDFRNRLTRHTLIHEDMKKFFEGYSMTGHPMAILASMVTGMGTYYKDTQTLEDADQNVIRLLAKVPSIAALSYKKSIGQPFVYPRNDLAYTKNFLHQMFAVPAEPYEVPKVMDDALNLLLVLHAE